MYIAIFVIFIYTILLKSQESLVNHLHKFEAINPYLFLVRKTKDVPPSISEDIIQIKAIKKFKHGHMHFQFFLLSNSNWDHVGYVCNA